MRHNSLIVIFFTLLFSSVAAIADSHTHIRGVVIGMPSAETIAEATVKLLRGDSSLIQSTTTASDGSFILPRARSARMLRIESFGYHTRHIPIQAKGKEAIATIDTLLIYSLAVRLDEIEITSNIPSVIVKGDTVEYNATGYQPGETDRLKDLIQRIPGMRFSDNGDITVNGVNISKILVDGEEFFGNEIIVALNNLPARMIKKLQLFTKETEEERITGIKSSHPDQVLNLIVKEEAKHSWFGNIAAGYGTDNAHNVSAGINRVSQKQQLSLLGNYSYLPREGSKMGTVYSAGINTSSSKLNKIRYSANFHVGGSKSKSETDTDAFSFAVNRKEEQRLHRQRDIKDIKGGFMFEWEPSEKTSLTLTAKIDYEDSDNKLSSNQLSYIVEKDTTQGFTRSNTKGGDLNWSTILWFAQKLNKDRRSFSAHASLNISRLNNDGMFFSQTFYPRKKPLSTVDQQRHNDTDRSISHVSVTYNEPVGERGVISLNYSINISESELLSDIYKKNPYGNYIVIDSAYARRTTNRSMNQTIRLSYQEWGEKYNFSLGLGALPSSSKTKIYLLDKQLDEIKQDVLNFSPFVYYSYRPDNSKTFDINYSGQSVRPTVGQLSTDTILHNSLSKSYGNPYLKPGFRGVLTMFWRMSNFEKSSFLSVNYQLNHMVNIVSPYVYVDSLANRVSTYRNVNGNLGMLLISNYSTALKNKRFTLDAGSNISYQRRVGYTNRRKSITNDWVFSQEVACRFMTRDSKLNTRIRLSGSYRLLNNSLLDEQQPNIFDGLVAHTLEYKLPYDFVIYSNFRYHFYVGYEEGIAENKCLWNFQLSKNFLKNKKATIAVAFYDVLDSYSNFSRTVNTEQAINQTTYSSNKYILLSFTYRLG